MFEIYAMSRYTKQRRREAEGGGEATTMNSKSNMVFAVRNSHQSVPESVAVAVSTVNVDEYYGTLLIYLHRNYKIVRFYVDRMLLSDSDVR